MSGPEDFAGDGRQVVDLDAVHKARREASDKPAPTVRLGGVDYSLPVSLPALVVVALGQVRNGDMAAMRDVLEGLFGAEHVDTVLRAGFDLDDVDAIFEGAYGDSKGEAPASASS